MFGNRVVMLALGVLLAAACSAAPAPSTADQLNRICADVRGTVRPLPSLKDLDTGDQIVPALNTQLAAAQDGQRRLAGVLASAADRRRYTDLQTTWDTAVGTLRQLRDTWQDPYAGLAYQGPGSDTAAALQVAGAEQDAQRDTWAVHDAAVRAGLADCADIPWHTGS